ncbi:autophagy-related protein 2 homolog A-like [Chamaea fasciata]|uniref:autophagy-related protein 2 homolog A-like n=1 Tax=Chamaea fasciata TaxID=190680 RepID=UPI00336A891F
MEGHGDMSPRCPRCPQELVVAVALEGVMLRHHPDPPGTPWYSQLLALLALEDEPVLGYTPPTPLTQLHLHLQRCGLDYRPPLPLRVLVTAETLSVTCGSGPDPRPGGLRLLVDDGSVFLSERCGGGALDLQRDPRDPPGTPLRPPGPPGTPLRPPGPPPSWNPSRTLLRPARGDSGVSGGSRRGGHGGAPPDFVSVLDVDFLELQLSTGRGGAAGEGGAAPSEELLVAPARLRGRTCADSAAAIARLLRHLGTPPGPPPGTPPRPRARPRPPRAPRETPGTARAPPGGRAGPPRAPPPPPSTSRT